MKLKELHQQSEPLLIGNVWDAASAQAAEKLGFRALGTSSAAIAKMLGYQDGEQMGFSELAYIVSRILANTKVPLSVDLEAGYSRTPLEIAKNIHTLAALGVAGINIEDSLPEGERRLAEANSFAEGLKEVKQQLTKENIDVFLNIRTDAFLLHHPDKVGETIKRAQLYEKAGADGLFTPGIEKEQDIAILVKSTNLPLNVMCMPALPDFDLLKAAGVKRISMGSFLFENMYAHFEQMLHRLVGQKSFKAVFAP